MSSQETTSTARRRINIVLPDHTLRMIDRIAPKGGRSRFIDEAVRSYVDTMGRAKLRRLLAEGGRQRAARDLAIAEEWFSVDEEAWRGEAR